MSKQQVLTRDDWLKAAMEALRTQGVGGVRVLTLARGLGVSRGSFYWHFENRQQLLDLMLDWWDREMTDRVIEHTGRLRGGLYRRALGLAELVLRGDLNRFDMAMRSWAQGDRKVATVVQRVMRKRLAFVTSLFTEASFSAKEAKIRGSLLAIYLMGEDAVLGGEKIEERLRLLRQQLRILTRP